MPTSLFSDVDGGGTNLQDPRFLQLALEMSMLGLNESEELSTFDSDERNTKGQNMTECVPVPSSEHVAEIVGRQGCKIKALRAKTNTYIKTPVRGEEPVFVVTGRKEDVTLAKKEIISAAEHFSQIRASRKNNMNGSTAPGPPNNIPGQITLQVRVPYRVVGLVVGPKGATIKRIQQQTNTYIVTPSREKLPVFEVTGLPDDVEIAKQEIEIHINARTGGQLDDDQNDFHTNGVDHSFNIQVDDDLNSVFKSRQNVLNSFNSALSSYCDNGKILSSRDSSSSFPFSSTSASTDLTSQFFPNNFQIYDSVEKRVSQSSPFNPAVAPPPTSSVWPDLRNSAYNLGTQPNGFSKRSYSISGPSTASRLSPSLADLTAGFLNNPQARRMCSDPVLSSSILPTSNGEAFDTSSALTSSSLLKLFNSMSTANNGVSSAAGSTSSSPTNSIGSAGPKEKRECLLCYESDVVAAFVPCGHNFFCMECATRVCGSENPVCPACNQPVDHAMRIYG